MTYDVEHQMGQWGREAAYEYMGNQGFPWEGAVDESWLDDFFINNVLDDSDWRSYIEELAQSDFDEEEWDEMSEYDKDRVLHETEDNESWQAKVSMNVYFYKSLIDMLADDVETGMDDENILDLFVPGTLEEIDSFVEELESLVDSYKDIQEEIDDFDEDDDESFLDDLRQDLKDLLEEIDELMDSREDLDPEFRFEHELPFNDWEAQRRIEDSVRGAFDEVLKYKIGGISGIETLLMRVVRRHRKPASASP